METVRNKTVCFTGHRQVAKGERAELLSLLYSTVMSLIEEGYDTFICGGAVGFDMEAAECVLNIRERIGGIRLVLYLPCRDQTARWNNTQLLVRYKHILGGADCVSYVRDFYANGCMLERNRSMVDSASVCVAYLKNSSGGTAYTVKYAEQNNLKVINLARK